ncbi:hypothetical protein JCM19992_24610 [Thermostilla marina]
MKQLDTRWNVFVVVLLGMALTVGCPKPQQEGNTAANEETTPAASSPEEATSPEAVGPSETPAEHLPDATTPADEPETEMTADSSGSTSEEAAEVAPPTVPEVVMGEVDRQTCKVFVGEAFPLDFELPQLGDANVALQSLLGSKATLIVLFATGDDPVAELQAVNLLEDIQRDCFEPYHDAGLQVVAVCEKAEADIAQKPVSEAGAKYAVLLDIDGNLFDAVATEKLPRLYLLDAEGTIVWLDIEYSNTTRTNLQQALKALFASTAGNPAK